MSNAKKLRDYESSAADDYRSLGTRYTDTDPETGAWVAVVQDDTDPLSPLDWLDDTFVAYPTGSGYSGNAEDIPANMAILCERCEGSGSEPDRYELIRYNLPDASTYGTVVASGSRSAMEFLQDRSGGTLQNCECGGCKGDGYTEAEDVIAYVRSERGAVGATAFSTGTYEEVQAVLYVLPSPDGWTDPQAAADIAAEEYKKYAQGDVWGVVSGDSTGEGDACWGFIGVEHAESEALEMMREAIAKVVERQKANVVLSEN